MNFATRGLRKTPKVPLTKGGLSSADPNKSNCSCELDLGEPVKSIIFNENDLFGLAFLIPRFSFAEGKRVWYGFPDGRSKKLQLVFTS